MLICEFCKKECKNPGGLAVHKSSCKLNENRIYRTRSPSAGARKGSIAWNKGLSGARFALSDETKQKLSKSCSGRAKNPLAEIERKRKISEKAKILNGGYRQGSGRGKKGWYKSFFCDSSWELAYVIYCLDHSINISRNTTIRLYEYEGKIRKYIPDFIVDGKLIEIKGYSSPQWKAKLFANPDVIVLHESDLTDVFDYVTRTYGKDFIRLYGK